MGLQQQMRAWQHTVGPLAGHEAEAASLLQRGADRLDEHVGDGNALYRLLLEIVAESPFDRCTQSTHVSAQHLVRLLDFVGLASIEEAHSIAHNEDGSP